MYLCVLTHTYVKSLFTTCSDK